MINSFHDRPHVIAVTEIKPTNLAHQLLGSEFNLPGYNIFSCGLDDSSKRGLLLYTLDHIEASLVDIPSAFHESLFVALKTCGNINSLLIGNVYRSPSSSIQNDE